MNSASIGYQCPQCAKDTIPVIRNIQATGFRDKDIKVTRFLASSLISIYVIQLVFGDILIQNFSLFAPAVSGGQWWRLLTAGFLHGSILHLFMNVYILWVIGNQIEKIIGSVKFSVIYFLSLIGGSLASFWFSPFGSYSIGASGAIFGLMGAMLIIGRKMRLDISQVAFLVGINVVLGFVLSGIDWRAHLGGLFVGVISAYLLTNATLWKEKNQR